MLSYHTPFKSLPSTNMHFSIAPPLLPFASPSFPSLNPQPMHIAHPFAFYPHPSRTGSIPPTPPPLSISPRCRHSTLSAFASLGFTADPRVGIERAANGLLKDAAALLVYQEVLRGPPAQAFLKVILALRRGEDGWKLLEAYGEFYKLMASGRYPSWEDFILDGILAGEGNPFAEAAANTGNPWSQESGAIPPSLLAAAAADLDSLQRLSITESTLVGWVTDLVADVRPEWRAAAESSLNSRNIRKIEEKSKNSGLAFPHSDDLATQSDALVEKSDFQIEVGVFKEHKNADILASGQENDAAEREKWRKRIGGLWRWSEAVPLLEKYYADHGVGRLACARALQCKGGKLLWDSKYCTRLNNCCELSIHKASRDMLFQNFRKHALRSPAHHVLVCGPSGSGKTWLVRSVLHTLTCQGEVRAVTIPNNEVKNINGILEELARNWQLRFVLVVDDLLLKGGEDGFLALKSAVDGSNQEWPANVLLCATSVRSDLGHGTHISDNKFSLSASLSDIFGIIFHLRELDMQSYLLSVEDILKHKQINGGLTSYNTPKEVLQQAQDWGTQRILSVRTAAQFVKGYIL